MYYPRFGIHDDDDDDDDDNDDDSGASAHRKRLSDCYLVGLSVRFHDCHF